MSGKTFGQKSKCLGLNRDFQANPGGVLSGEGVFCQCLERRGFVCMQICAERKRGRDRGGVEGGACFARIKAWQSQSMI